MVPSLSGKSYEEKLAEVNIMSLAARRTRTDLIQTFKILKGVDNVNHEHWFKLFGTADRQTRLSSYPLNIIVKPAKKDVRRNFSNRVRDIWNDLPTDAKNANTVTQLKQDSTSIRSKCCYHIDSHKPRTKNNENKEAIS